jgi:hypothetical protein
MNTKYLHFLLIPILLLVFSVIVKALPSPTDNPTNPGWTVTHIDDPPFAYIALSYGSSFYTNGSYLANGDYIGVFYEVGGIYKCGGYIIYPQNFIQVYGDPSGNNGFQSNEQIFWKIWKLETNTTHNATAIYDNSGVLCSYCNISGNFNNFGFGLVTTLNDGVSPANPHPFSLPSNWSLFSLTYNPSTPSPVSFFNPAGSSIKIVKDGSGNVYSPSPFVNTLGNLSVGKGYLALCSSPISYNYSGQEVSPEIIPINYTTGWNLLGYTRTSSGNIQNMFNSVLQAVLMVKSENGQVYIPSLNINQISQLLPQKAYWVKMNAAGSFFYPVN